MKDSGNVWTGVGVTGGPYARGGGSVRPARGEGERRGEEEVPPGEPRCAEDPHAKHTWRSVCPNGSCHELGAKEGWCLSRRRG